MLLTCSRSPPPQLSLTASKHLCVCQWGNRELKEQVTEGVWEGEDEGREGWWGVQQEVSNPRTRNFLLCKHSFHLPCLLPSSQTGVNTLESPGLSQSSRFLLRFSLPLLSLSFSVALNILSSPVMVCPVCVPLSPHLFLPSKCFPSAPPRFLFHSLATFPFTSDLPVFYDSAEKDPWNSARANFYSPARHITPPLTPCRGLFVLFFSSKGIKRGEWKWSSYFWCIPWCLQSSYPRDLTCAFAVSLSGLHHFCGELLHLCEMCTQSKLTTTYRRAVRLRQSHIQPVVVLFYRSWELLTNTQGKLGRV